MRKALLYGAGDLRLEERELDTAHLEARQIYVETEVTAFSTGTDLGNYLGRSKEVPGAPDYPRGVGYSNVGVVRRTGAGVRHLAPGQRVFSMMPHQSAYIAAEGDVLVPVPDGVSSETASLAYLTHLGLAAMRQARYEIGEDIAVVGLGVIGLCACGLARAMGAKVAAIANSPIRTEAALRVGAHTAWVDPQDGATPALFGGAGADIVILTANTWSAYRLSLEIAREGGRVSLLGFPGRGQPPPDFNPLDPRWIYRKQLALFGAGMAPDVECPPSAIRFTLRRNLEYILDLMSRGAFHPECVISHAFPANRMVEAYDLARDHAKHLVAAVFDWRTTQGAGA
jgi:threonine dehydrogenase-like Zn-dependent dehydrogenase